MNFDAALFESSGCVGIGVAVRDSDGEIIAALSQRIPLPHSVMLAEALAAHRAVVFMQEMSLYKVMVEGDCLRLVSTGCNTLYGNVIEETHRLDCQF